MTAVSLMLSMALALASQGLLQMLMKTNNGSSRFTLAPEPFFLAQEISVVTLGTTIFINPLSYPN